MSKKIHINGIIFLFILCICFITCSKDDPAPVPGVNSFYPLTATTGEPVKITGKNFGTATAVSFGGMTAKSFKVISDSVIFAYVGTGASGDVSVITPAGNNNLAGFTFYMPQQYTLYGTSAYGSIPWPQKDSSFYHPSFIPDTATFIIKKINRYDSLAIGTNAFFPEYSPYVDSPNYVILSGVGPDGKGSYRFFPNATPTSRPLSVFAKIVDSVITIPMQTPEYWLWIQGNGIIKNNKISLKYLTDYRGSSKSASLKSP